MTRERSYNLHSRSRAKRFRRARQSRRHRMIKAAVEGITELEKAKKTVDEALDAVIALQKVLGDADLSGPHRKSLVIGTALMKASAGLVELKRDISKGAGK